MLTAILFPAPPCATTCVLENPGRNQNLFIYSLLSNGKPAEVQMWNRTQIPTTAVQKQLKKEEMTGKEEVCLMALDNISKAGNLLP